MSSNHLGLEIDLETAQVRKGAKLIPLTQKEWDLLRVLVRHKNQTLSHEFLLQAVWGDGYKIESNYLYVHIKQLRGKLGASAGDSQYILTVPKLGYQWVDKEDVETPAGFKPASQQNWHSVPPMPFTSFIGRERELALLEKLIRKRDVRLLSLTGPGGIGKTRLSLELVTLLQDPDLFADGIHFIDLQTVDHADFVVNAIAQVFGIREKAAEELISSLKSYLRDKNLLLILDNFEQVQAAAVQVLEILKAARGAKFLITSRERLDLYGEHNFEVPPLSLTSYPTSTQGQMITLSEAVQLFAERAEAVNPRFEVGPENAAILQQICDRLDGLPLAIELTAVQSKRFAPQEVLKRLDDRLQLLVGAHSDLPPRHQTLQAAIDWSYQLLDVNEQELFVALSVFNGSFTVDAAEAVCSKGATAVRRVPQTLTALCNKSLLNTQWEESCNEFRYVMLGSFREFANGLLDRNSADDLGRRHAQYYDCLLEQSKLVSPEQRIGRLALELGNLRSALKWAIAHKAPENALRLSVGMNELWLKLGILREGKQRLFEALDAAEGLETPLRALGLNCAGALVDWLGEPLVAQGLYRESLRLYEALGDATGIASTLHLLATALINQGDFAEGRSRSEQARRVAQEHDKPKGIALALSNLGMVSIYQGEAQTAREFYEEMLSVSQANKNLASEMGWALTGLSWVELLHGNYEAAQEYINHSLAIHYQSSDMLSATLALVCDSWIALYQADVAVAAGKLSACLTLCRELGIVQLSLWPLAGLARIDLYRGNAPQARASLEEALRLCQQLNFPPMTTWVYIAFGKLLRLEGDIETAFDDLDRGLTLSRKRDDKSALVTALEEFAAHFAVQNKYEPAAKLYGAAEALRETYRLPLPKIDGIERDQVLNMLRSKKNLDWNAHWQLGRSLKWDEITQLIYHT